MTIDQLRAAWSTIVCLVIALAGVGVFWAYTLDRSRRFMPLLAVGGMLFAVGLWMQVVSLLPWVRATMLLGAVCMIGGLLIGVEAIVRRAGRSMSRYTPIASAIAVFGGMR